MNLKPPSYDAETSYSSLVQEFESDSESCQSVNIQPPSDQPTLASNDSKVPIDHPPLAPNDMAPVNDMGQS